MDLRTIISRSLGPVAFLEEEIPGVYYVSVQYIRTGLPREYYIIEADTGTISDDAKAFGKPVLHHPELLTVLNGATGGGDLIIRYEIKLYKLRHDIPVPENDGLYETAMFGMLDYPDYFGDYPAPIATPEGRTVRYKRLRSGVFDLVTETGNQLLAIAESVWDAELVDSVVSHGVQKEGYLFICPDKAAVVLEDLELS